MIWRLVQCRSPRCVVLAILSLLLAAPTAFAQPDLNDMAVDWLRGRWASPVMCEIGGEVVRGLRRLTITREVEIGRAPVARIRFVDMKVEEATRCFDSLGHAIPNLLGQLDVRVPGRSHPETAKRDFKRAMKRGGGFDYEVVSGRVKLVPVGPADDGGEAAGAKAARVVEFRGGAARATRVMPATDADRELASFDSPRRLLVELTSRDGKTSVRLPLFLVGPP